MDDGSPPAALFSELAKKWASVAVEDEALAAGHSTPAAVDIDVGALSETGRTAYAILMSLEGRRSEVLDRLDLLTISSEGQVAVLH